MDLLLDTHAFLWWIDGDPALSAPARNAIGNPANIVYVSAASAWEIATKARIGKLPNAVAVASDIQAVLTEQGFRSLAVTVAHGQTAGSLPVPHKDPFDRMLMAQAMLDDMVLVSNERRFDPAGIRRLW